MKSKGLSFPDNFFALFGYYREIPNEETLKAISESERAEMLKAPGYETVEEMLKSFETEMKDLPDYGYEAIDKILNSPEEESDVK